MSRSRKRNDEPVAKIRQFGVQVSVFWTARAVAALAKNLRLGNFFRLSIPEEWSLCSWVTKTASTPSIDSPAAAISPVSRRAEKPASRSIRVCSVTTSALLPELPLPRMQNLIDVHSFSADERPAQRNFRLRVDRGPFYVTSYPPCRAEPQNPRQVRCPSRARCISTPATASTTPRRGEPGTSAPTGPAPT